MDRFWSKVNKEGPVPTHKPELGPCWVWTGKPRPGNYGEFWVGNGKMLAHRFSYQLLVGPVEGLQIDHDCRNRMCVNPHHLRSTTTKQNMENRVGAAAHSKSGVRGVWWVGGRIQKWRAGVRHHGRMHNVGYFDDLKLAAAAVQAKRNELFTHNGEASSERS